MRAIFYDIESLGDAFTLCAYDYDEPTKDGKGTGVLHVFYLTDNIPCVSEVTKKDASNFRIMGKTVADRIRERNKNFSGDIYFWNLGSNDPAERIAANERMAQMFGASDAGNPNAFKWAIARRNKLGANAPKMTDEYIDVAPMVNDPRCASTFGPKARLTCDTDIDKTYVNQAGETIHTQKFDGETMPYLMGFNSQNYDTTMLALYFNEATKTDISDGSDLVWTPPTAEIMRQYNDALFAPEIKDQMYTAPSFGWDAKAKRFDGCRARGGTSPRRPDAIRKNMINSGRHIDVARLVETQYKQGLKRLLGFLGLQILESDKLRDAQKLETLENFAELIAYNVSDVVNLRELFFADAYYAQFENKRALMNQYPDVVYNKKPRSYRPDISPYHVRQFGRLLPDSRSAQFATKILCPWGHLKDIEGVSYLYPSKRVAREMGVQQRNVLEDCLDFVKSKVGEDSELYREFKPVYDYYKSIEGKNFNNSKNYANDYGYDPSVQLPPTLDLASDLDVPKGPSCVRYWRDKTTPTSCYVNFSVGGIHGAEYNIRAFEAAHAAWEDMKALVDAAKELFEGDAVACRKARTFEIDGVEHEFKEVLKGGKTIPNSEWKDVDELEPTLFQKQKNNNSTRLNPKWTYTSADEANHEDFSSYYPNLLRQMDAFRNPELVKLGEDRYATIYDQKQTFGKYEKDMSLSAEKREYYRLVRNGTKLILNAATGAADTSSYSSPIQMNNRIISMRIIGQLFSWRIGQAQAFEGAKVTSTNTDGLYTVMEKTRNNEILENESKSIGVEIEPEPMFFISKDTNNRMELDEETRKISAANGGTLAHFKGVNLGKSLAHAAILDWLCANYLVTVTDPNRDENTPSIEEEFDKELGRKLLEKARDEMDATKFLTMVSTIVASSPGSNTYVFGTKEEDPHDGEPTILQHYNRAFFLKNPTERTLHLHAARPRVITPAVMAKRRREKEAAIANGESEPKMKVNDPWAMTVLIANGVDPRKIQQLEYESGKELEAAINQISGIDESLNVLIENHAIKELDDDTVTEIVNNLDLDAYVDRVAETFEKNWRNHV